MQEDRTLGPRHRTCIYINALANIVMLHYTNEMIFTQFLKLNINYISPQDQPPRLSSEKFLVRAWLELRTYILHLNEIMHIPFAPDWNYAYTFCTLQELCIYLLHLTGITHIPFAPDWNYAYTFSTWLELRIYLLHLTGIMHIPLAPDWNYAYTFCIWLELRTYLLHLTGIKHIPFAPEWNYVYTSLHLNRIMCIPFAPDWNYAQRFAHDIHTLVFVWGNHGTKELKHPVIRILLKRYSKYLMLYCSDSIAARFS